MLDEVARLLLQICSVVVRIVNHSPTLFPLKSNALECTLGIITCNSIKTKFCKGMNLDYDLDSIICAFKGPP